MTEPSKEPGHGRSTAEAAVKEIKKQIAARNEAAHRADRKKREPRERALVEKRRRDMLK